MLEYSVFVTKALTILSQAGPAATIVDLNYNISFGSVFYVTENATIRGLTIRGGAPYVTGYGGGILVDHADATITDNLLLFDAAGGMEGEDGPGSALYAHDGQVVVRNNTIVANQGSTAIYFQRCGGSFENNIVAYNSGNGAVGYGIGCDASTVSIVDNVFWMNPQGAAEVSCGAVTGAAGNVSVDPKFCNVVLAPWLGTPDFGVRSDSPVAPGHEYAGRGAPLPMCLATPAHPATWGSIKARYR
jgi:hypothetical protein